MQYYEKYVVIERLRKKVTCGEINLPYGTECQTSEGTGVPFVLNLGSLKFLSIDL